MDDYQGNNEVIFNEAEKIRSGIIAAFPNINSYKSYIEVDKGKAEPFLNIAREYGIPAVLGTAKATECLKDEDTVSVNGFTGEIIWNF